MKPEFTNKKEIKPNKIFEFCIKKVTLVLKKAREIIVKGYGMILPYIKKTVKYIREHWRKIVIPTTVGVIALAVLLVGMLKSTDKSEVEMKISDIKAPTVIPIYPSFDPMENACIAVVLNWTDGAIDLNGGIAQARIKAEVYPITVRDKTITWSSADENIATVDEEGNITASNPGKVRINAVLKSEHIGASALLSVRQPVSGIFLKTTTLTLAVNGEGRLIQNQIIPQNATNQNIIWSSKNSKIARVDATGRVEPVNPGITEITATTEDGNFEAKCFVTVINSTVEPEKVEVKNGADMKLKVGESVNAIATVSPSNAKNKTLKWTSDNTSVASVSQTGRIKGVSVGKANITVETHNGKKTVFAVEIAASDERDPFDLNVDTQEIRAEGGITYTSYSISFPQAVRMQMIQNPPPKIWQSGGSVFASEMETAKYMNPNDFYQDAYKYQFLDLSKPNNVSEERLNEYLADKGVLRGKGAVFIEAAKRYNISEVYLVAHACLESGNGTSRLASGVGINGTTVYNVFGINAYDSDPVGSGASRAYAEGWTSVDDAIIGGAGWISEHYINNVDARQNTLYKMRWNPENPGDHQYATDIGWAVEQAVKIEKIFAQFADSTLSFDIPVYDGQIPPSIEN